jgi:PTS system mannose-specific IIA component
MIGVVLAAHGEVGPALLKAAEAIVGGLHGVRAVTLESGADPQRMREDVCAAVRAVDEGEGVLVLVDMFGGTPSNVCLSAETGTPTEVVTGVNLPMLIKASTARSATSLTEAAASIAQYGQRHIAHATQLLRDRRAASERACAAPAASAPGGAIPATPAAPAR